MEAATSFRPVVVLHVPYVPVNIYCATGTTCYGVTMERGKKDQRIPVMMSLLEVGAIDAWRSTQPGIPTRSEAIRQLVAKGLQAE